MSEFYSPPLDCSHEEFCKFHDTLEVGERVIEHGESCMTGWTGVIVETESGKCVRWDVAQFADVGVGSLTTSVTGGTRRVPDATTVLESYFKVMPPWAKKQYYNDSLTNRVFRSCAQRGDSPETAAWELARILSGDREAVINQLQDITARQSYVIALPAES